MVDDLDPDQFPDAREALERVEAAVGPWLIPTAPQGGTGRDCRRLDDVADAVGDMQRELKEASGLIGALAMMANW